VLRLVRSAFTGKRSPPRRDHDEVHSPGSASWDSPAREKDLTVRWMHPTSHDYLRDEGLRPVLQGYLNARPIEFND
jgi:hypothetical protein